MEKLKAKHDHKLTDILKVAIFGLMLILPGLILLPSMLYYGVNEHATAPTEQVEKIEYERVNFNQLFEFEGGTRANVVITNNNGLLEFSGITTSSWFPFDAYELTENNYFILKLTVVSNPNNINFAVSDLNNGSLSVSPTNPIIKVQSLRTPPRTFGMENFSVNTDFTGLSYYFNIFDLTQMFGSGNEPTIQEFKNYYPNDYYEYTDSRYEILEIPTGTYETYTDITSQIQYNWNSLWQQPLFSWTNYTILKQGLDNFTNVFGITQTSNINNLIVYELIMVAIYIVIDIVLTLFKWLTHLIGEK